jgi:hypothetical protein
MTMEGKAHVGRMTPKDIVAIVGFPRCGSSLTGQMLAAAGFPVNGTYPLYDEYTPLVDDDWQEYRTMAGKAVKVLDAFLVPELGPPPDDVPQRFIRLRRDPDEQAKSFWKFARATIVGFEQRAVRLSAPGIAESFRRDASRLDAMIEKAGPVFHVQFSDLLTRPAETAKSMGQFIGFDLDIEAAARQVIERGSECQPDLSIEGELMARAPW